MLGLGFITMQLNEGYSRVFLLISEASLVIVDRPCQSRGLAYFQHMATGPESSFTGNSSTFLSLLL